jgi:hypothetical protein
MAGGCTREDEGPSGSPRDVRATLLELLQPVALTNCELARFGEPNDGGYLMCANLLDGVEVAYSYGISGYDQWGCDVAARRRVRLHQYDCFDTRQTSCPGVDVAFHPVCVAGERRDVDGRFFDTIQNQLVMNGDATKRLALKIDVEGAEWESFLGTPDDVFDRIDQMVVEFHWDRVGDGWDSGARYLPVLERLRRVFHVAHVHFNNASCVTDLEPFPSWAYEVLFVNKRLGTASSNTPGFRPHPLDAPNTPSVADCQLPPR